MARKHLNSEEIAKLRECPFVSNVVTDRVSFTPEFKQMAYRQLVAGKAMRDIFEDNGIDPEILGEARIWGFAHNLRVCADREEGFVDLRFRNVRKPAKRTVQRDLSTRVEQLEHELAYTRQEVEFLKKIQMVDLEARKQWESKLHRK